MSLTGWNVIPQEGYNLHIWKHLWKLNQLIQTFICSVALYCCAIMDKIEQNPLSVEKGLKPSKCCAADGVKNKLEDVGGSMRKRKLYKREGIQ